MSESEPVLSRDFTITNKLGMHARPAAMFVKTAAQFDSEIMVCKGGGHLVSGKSIMGLMTLEASPGTVLTVTAEGFDADEALGALGDLIAGNFNEE